MTILKNICVVFLLFAISGCFYFTWEHYTDILFKPSSSWDYRECLTVISASIRSNYNDFRTNIKVSVTPYYPSVVFALKRNEQIINNLSEEEYRKNVDILLWESNGLYMDWDNNRLVDSRGNYYREFTQIDSMMYLVSINNTTWTTINSNAQVVCNGMLMIVPLISFDQCYIPDITDIDSRIFLINDKGEILRPKYVWGRRNTLLTNEETLFVMFNFKNEVSHFFKDVKSYQIIIKGFESDIKLDFDLKILK